MKHSLIIVAYKAEKYLLKCLESLLHNPPEPGKRTSKADAEIILIDNSPEPIEKHISNDFLVKLLQTYVQVKVEWHPENLGFAAACNRGAEMAEGKILTLINPDTIVFPEWAERMEAHLGPTVGAVGPLSNFVAGFQRADIHMQTAEDWGKTARMAAKGNNLRGVDTKLLIGFFLMVKREAWDKVGGMDPQFFLGCDDLDLSLRLRYAGYGLVIASDVFVYHEGHKSFEESPASLALNKQSDKKMLAKLQAKYGDNIPTSTELWGCEILPTHVPKRQTLSVCMIVKNEHANLAELLPTLTWADEVVIVDTSADYNMARSLIPWPYGVERVLSSHPWSDDFADSRNWALSCCTSAWVLWLDADDRVTPESAAMIRAALDNPGPRTQAKTVHFGFMLRDHGPDGLNYAAGHPRMFPRVPGMKWEGRVHESYMPNAAKLGIEKVDCNNIIIDHYGYQDPAVMPGKHARNLRLMEMEPDSPKKFYHMAKNLQGLGRYKESEECYLKVLDPNRWAAPLDPEFRDHARLCFASLILTVKGPLCEDVDPYLEDNSKPDALFLRAEVAMKRGHVFKAEEMYKEYASWDRIIDSFGSQQEYLQRVARERLEVIRQARERVYGQSAAA